MRKIIAIFCLTGLLYSCTHTRNDNDKIEKLNQRISELEQRLESIGNNNAEYVDKTDNTTITYTAARQMDRCLALTKKGTQCKRAGKNHGYCWQHEERR